MEIIILIVFFALTFTIFLLGYISLHWKRRLLFLSLGFTLCIFFFVSNLFVVLPLKYVSMPLVLSLLFGSQIVALPIIHWRTGKLCAKADEVYRTAKRWSLLLLIFVVPYLLLTFIPSKVPYSGEGGPSPYTREYFLDRFPFWTVFTILIIYLLTFALSRVGVREKGIVQFNNFIDWSELLSYSWYELDEQLRLRLEFRRLGSKPATVIYLVSQKEKQAIDTLLTGKLKRIIVAT